MKKENYEHMIERLIRSAHIVDHSKNPCEEGFIPVSANIKNELSTWNSTKSYDNPSQTYVIFVKQTNSRDFQTWLHVAKCFRIWDLDARGYHNSMWRFFWHQKHILVIGVPHSPYSHLKPPNITPISINDTQNQL